MTISLAVSAILLAAPQSEPPPAALAAAEPSVIDLTASVEAPVAEVFAMFATAAGVRTLFPGADARIDARVGGDYCVMFDPHGDPHGDRQGTNGCKFLKIEKDRLLEFEWSGPPQFPEMNVEPFPTRIRVEFRPAGEHETRLRLRHEGFSTGGTWAAARAFFERNWRATLVALEQRFAASPRLDPALANLETTTAYVVRLEPGPGWLAERPAAQQPRIINHLAHMQRLFREGRLLMGGKVGPHSGLGILTVPDLATARRVIEADPAVQAGTLRFEIEPWQTSLPDRVRRALRPSSR